MCRLARRITDTVPKSFGMYGRAAALAAQGQDLIRLEVGMPHADTPAAIKQATIDALMSGHVHYSELRGIAPLRAAIRDKLLRRNGIDVPMSQIIVTNGLTHASFAAIMAIIDDGDEAIFLEPWYPQHIGKVELAGGRVVRVPLDAANGFAIDAAAVRSAITPRTRMIVLINPCNPTGRVYSRTELLSLAEIAIRHDLIVLSDEVYEDIVFDGATHVSIASLPGMAERTISMFAFTKSYAMDGWRIGYMAVPDWAVDAVLKVTSNDVTHVNTFIQHGALAALSAGPGIQGTLLAEDARKRDIAVRRLNQMAGVICPAPEGTIYAFPDIRGTGLASQEAAERLLAEAGVAVEAGSFYGPAGEGHLRICFGAVSEDRLVLAMDRMQRFFGTI